MQRSLSNVGPGVEIAERTFASAWRRSPDGNVVSVIVSLDAEGHLVETPINVPPGDSKVLGSEPHGLLIISVPLHGTGNLVRVSLAADGRLVPSAPVPLPDVAWGWPTGLTSDGARATLRHALAAPDQSIADEVSLTIDLGSHRVIASVPAPALAAAPIIGPVPEPASQTIRRVARDGIVEVAWDGGHTEAHAPLDSDRIVTRSSLQSWYFKGGQIRLLRMTGDRWTSIDPVPFALHDVAGTMHTGYSPVILRNGAHVAVLLAAEGQGPAWVQPYRVPCSTRRP